MIRTARACDRNEGYGFVLSFGERKEENKRKGAQMQPLVWRTLVVREATSLLLPSSSCWAVAAACVTNKTLQTNPREIDGDGDGDLILARNFCSGGRRKVTVESCPATEATGLSLCSMRCMHSAFNNNNENGLYLRPLPLSTHRSTVRLTAFNCNHREWPWLYDLWSIRLLIDHCSFYWWRELVHGKCDALMLMLSDQFLDLWWWWW